MDKRPLGIMGAVFFVTVVILSKFGFDKALCILPIFLIAVFLVLLRQRKIMYFVLIASSVLCAVCIFQVKDNQFTTNEKYFSGKNMCVEGVICETNYYDEGKNYYIIKTDKINSEDVRLKIRVSDVEKLDSHKLYSRVKLKANLYPADNLELFGQSYMKPENICLLGSCVSGTLEIVENESKPIIYYILSYRHRLFDAVADLLPTDIGGFIIGITIGEKELLSDELLNRFNITGTSHIIVVSGMHIAVLSGFLYYVLKRILNFRIASVISIVFVVLFMAFTGFTPSVIRAGAMMIFSFAARMFNEKPDSLNTLGMSAILLTAVQPFSVYNVGTVFSYASVLGILLMNEHILPRFKKYVEKINSQRLRKFTVKTVSIILVSLSAQVFTFPVSVIYNIEFSFISVLANFLISTLCDIVMVAGCIGVVLLSVLPSFIFTKIFFGSSIIISKAVIAIIYKIAEHDEFYMSVTNLQNYMFLAIVLLLLFVLIFSNLTPKRKVKVFVSFLVPVFLLSSLASEIYKMSFVEFRVNDVGHGMCITISHSGETVVLACGSDNTDDVIDNFEYLKTKNIITMYLPVDNNLNLVNCAVFASQCYNVERVITSAEYKFSGISDNVISADYVKTTYWNSKVEINYYTKKNCSFALVKIGNERILVNFYGQIRDEFLSEDCKNPDVYVTMYENTYKTNYSAIKEYVVSNSYEASVPVTADNVHTTYNDSAYTKLIKV